MKKEDIRSQMAKMAVLVKIVCGVANNCAWLACLEAHDKVKHHPRYRQACKKAYKDALAEFHRYEQELVYGFQHAFFSVDKLPAEEREKFADITDREYYELWAACGAQVYQHTRPMLTSLQNKYRIALEHIDAEDAEIYSWALTAQLCLELAVFVHNEVLWPLPQGINLRREVVKAVFGKFSLRKVAKKWYKAITLTDPRTFGRDFTPADDKNIKHGIDQLAESWTDAHTIFASALETLRTSDDMFASRSDHKCALRSVGDFGRAVIREM